MKEYGWVWYDLSSCTKGNPFIYTTIPLKEGDISVRKRNAWTCHVKKYSIPCRKYSIIWKGYSRISSCTLRDHGIPWGQCSMPLCKFPWKGCQYICSFLWKEVILKGYSWISSCTLRDHGIPWGQCSMPLCKFPWKGCNIILFVHSFEKRVVFLGQKKTTQTEPPPPENRK